MNILMFLSGASALALEVVWMRMLHRAFGVTVHAVAVVVAVYMGGLALGAFLSGRLKRERDWLVLYGLLEAGVAAAALASTWAMGILPGVTAGLEASASWAALLRMGLSAAVLLPPTALMGATLPVLTRRWAQSRIDDGVEAGVGTLYGANTLGAAAGLALAGFVLIATWGERATVAAAVSLNILAAALAWTFAWREGGARASRPPALPEEARHAGDPVLAGVLFAASGFCALGYEVLWARQIMLVLGNSTYAFTLLLLFYLAGVGLGSVLIGVSRDEGRHPLETFSLLEWALTAAAALSLAAFKITALAADSRAYLYSTLAGAPDFARLAAQACVMVLPASVVMGMLFPVAARLACGSPAGAGAAVGRVYAWNTVGGILGSLAAGFIGVSALGTHGSFLALVGLNGLTALAALLVARSRALKSATIPSLGLAVAAVALVAFARTDPVPEALRKRLLDAGPFDLLFHQDTPEALITGVERAGSRTLLINGIETAGNSLEGTLMALLPDSLIAGSSSTLVVCFGAGNTFRTSSLLGAETHGVDLISGLFRAMPHFYADAGKHLSAPGRQVFAEDGRTFIQRRGRRYDSIIVDASPPLYSAGAVNLYTREFLGLARGRLAKGGVFCLWLPFGSFEDDYWAITRSMTEAFPQVRAWTGFGISGFILFGTEAPLRWKPGGLDRRFRERSRDLVSPEIRALGVEKGFVLGDAELRELVRSTPPVTDDRPGVEFPLGRFLRGRPLMWTPRFLLEAKASLSAPLTRKGVRRVP